MLLFQTLFTPPIIIKFCIHVVKGHGKGHRHTFHSLPAETAGRSESEIITILDKGPSINYVICKEGGTGSTKCDIVLQGGEKSPKFCDVTVRNLISKY